MKCVRLVEKWKKYREINKFVFTTEYTHNKILNWWELKFEKPFWLKRNEREINKI